MKRFAVLLGAGLVIGAPVLIAQEASAQIRKQGNGYLMRINWQKGKVYNFNVKTSFTMPGPGATGSRSQPQPMSMSSTAALRVTGVRNGVADVEVTTTSPAMSGTQSTPQKATVKMNNRGVVQGQGTTSVVASLPEKPVAVGGTWTSTVTSPSPMGGRATVNSRNTLKAVRQAGSRQIAEITTTGTVKGGGMSGTTRGTFTIDMADGMVVSYRVTTNMSVTMPAGNASGQQAAKPQTMNIPMTIEMTRR